MKKSIKALFNIFIIIIAIIALYPFIKFDYYELSRTKKIVDSITIPTFSIFLLFYNSYNIYNKKGALKEYLFVNFLLIFLTSSFYFLMLRSFLSSCLLSFNSIYPKEETVLIKGVIKEVVMDNIYIKGLIENPKKCGIGIQTHNNIYYLESKEYLIDSIEIGDEFNIKMKKGLLGILYK